MIDFLENCHVSRIGKEKPETSRLMKVHLPSTDVRNEILNNAPAFKALPEPWSKVYIKKDLTFIFFQVNWVIEENVRFEKKIPKIEEKISKLRMESCRLMEML